MKRITTFIVILGLITAAYSQVPQHFNFQAVARTSNGDILSDKSLVVRVGILQGETLLWQEDHSVLTNDLGIFTLLIGGDAATNQGGALDAFSQISWGDGNMELRLQVDSGNGFEAMGTTKLSSVPYALFAENSEPGPQGDPPAHQWDGTSIQFQKPDGTWGPLVDLQGDPATDDQTLTLTGATLGITNGNTVQLDDIVMALNPWQMNFDTLSTRNLVTITTQDAQVDAPLFEVKNDLGNPVFAVYNDGVMVFVDEQKKGVKGGFAVGGYNSATKGISQEYMRITPDSVRIWVPDDVPAKGVKGGFAVGGYTTAGKATANNYLEITRSSTSIYFDTTSLTKGVKGGFAVGGYNSAKSVLQDFLQVTPDSTRVYVNATASKGAKGGFAVGGYSTGKGEDNSFMTLLPDNYFIGHLSGDNITTGLYNSVMGYESGMNITSGNSNAFLGYQAGFRNAGGDGNLFLGYQTGYANVEGNYNTFMGYNSGYSNTDGTNNTFLGSFTGLSNSSGSYNTYVGDSSGYYSTIGSYNTFLGTKSGYHNIDGWSNVFIGNNAGYSNETGFENVMIGRNAGIYGVTGSRNVFLGTGAGFVSGNGWDNIYIGTKTGFSNEDGAGNVFIGYNSGLNNVHGVRNIFLGNNAGVNEMGSNRLYITNWHSDSASSMIWGDLGNDWGDLANYRLRFNSMVGINTHPNDFDFSIYGSRHGNGSISLQGPGNGFDYSNIFLRSDTVGPDNFYILAHTLQHDYFMTYHDGRGNYFTRLAVDSTGKTGINTAPGIHTLYVNDQDDIATLALRGAGNQFDYSSILLKDSVDNGGRLFSMAHTKDNHFFLMYNDGSTVYPFIHMDTLGNMSLNMWEDGTETLDVNGNARFRGVGTAAGTYDLWLTAEGVLTTSASDARLKTAFAPITNSLDRIMKLNGVTFQWKDELSERRDAGLVAQEVAEVFPEAVFENPVDGYMGVNYSRFPALFVEAIKEQQQVIESQREEIDALKERMAQLEQMLLESK